MRGQISWTGTETLVTGGYATPKKKMTHGLIRNISGDGTACYVEWTEVEDALSASNGFKVEDGDTLGIELDRNTTNIHADVTIFTAGTAKICYAFE